MKIELFYTDTCPDCPPARAVVKKVLRNYPQVVLEEINAKEQKERAKLYGLTHVPTIIMDGEVVFIEKVEEEALRKEIERRVA